MNPFIGGLPDDNPDPQGQVGGHEMNKSKSCKQSEPLNNDGGVDEQEVHLEEGEESLQYGVSDHNIVDTVGVVHGGVHGDFQPNEYQRSKAEN